MPTPKDQLDVALELAKNNQTKEALTVCQNILKDEPENDLAHYLKGHLLTTLQDFPQAEEHLLKALSLQPNNIVYMNSLGCLRIEQKDFWDAIRIFELILDSEDFAPAKYNLGAALIKYAEEHQIFGWFEPEEAAALFLFAKKLKKHNPVIVELGSCFGLSSMIFALATGSIPEAKIYCIDIWDDDGLSVDGKTAELVKEMKANGVSFIQTFKNLMQDVGVLDQLTPMKGYTSDIVKDWQEPIDILFIDASHTYEGTKEDFINWNKHIVAGGILLMHDVELPSSEAKKNSGPGRVVEEKLLNNSEYCEPILIQTLYKVVKK